MSHRRNFQSHWKTKHQLSAKLPARQWQRSYVGFYFTTILQISQELVSLTDSKSELHWEEILGNVVSRILSLTKQGEKQRKDFFMPKHKLPSEQIKINKWNSIQHAILSFSTLQRWKSKSTNRVPSEKCMRPLWSTHFSWDWS